MGEGIGLLKSLLALYDDDRLQAWQINEMEINMKTKVNFYTLFFAAILLLESQVALWRIDTQTATESKILASALTFTMGMSGLLASLVGPLIRRVAELERRLEEK